MGTNANKLQKNRPNPNPEFIQNIALQLELKFRHRYHLSPELGEQMDKQLNKVAEHIMRETTTNGNPTRTLERWAQTLNGPNNEWDRTVHIRREYLVGLKPEELKADREQLANITQKLFANGNLTQLANLQLEKTEWNLSEIKLQPSRA